MMKFKIITILISCLLISQMALAENIKPSKLMTEIFPPFQYEYEGKAIGISIDIVRAIQEQIGDDTTIKIYPWSRGLKLLNKYKNSALFSMLRTPDRENQYKWVGPITSMQMVFFKKKGNPLTLKSIEDVKKVNKVGVTKNVGNHQMMKAKGFTNLDVITSGGDEKNIKKLIKGRIDLWPSLKMSGLHSAREMGLADEIVAIDNVIAFSGEMYIAFNKKTDENMIKRWQQALDELVKSGKVEKIINNYK